MVNKEDPSRDTPKEFKNESVMLTDLMQRKDSLSIRLIEYFSKNFDVKMDKIKEKYMNKKENNEFI